MRRPLHLLSLISLLLLLAAAGMWVRSYWRGDVVVAGWTRGEQWDDGVWEQTRYSVRFESGRGGAALRWEIKWNAAYQEQPPPRQWLAWRHEVDSKPERPSGRGHGHPKFDVLGISLHYWIISGYGGSTDQYSFCLPYGAVCLPAALLPVRWVLVRRARRRRAGEVGVLCGGCGYDLRSSPDPASPAVGRCPECGRVQPAATVVAGGQA